MTTTTATCSAFEIGKATLDLARGTTLKMIDGIPQDKLTFQPFPKANHVLWVLGHCAVSDAYFCNTMGTENTVQIDESWGELFGMGSTPVADATKYPSLEKLTDAMKHAREGLLEWFSSMDDAKLNSPLPEDWKMFGPNFAALMNSIAWHEAIHTGQLTNIRRALDLPGALGLEH